MAEQVRENEADRIQRCSRVAASCHGRRRRVRPNRRPTLSTQIGSHSGRPPRDDESQRSSVRDSSGDLERSPAPTRRQRGHEDVPTFLSTFVRSFVRLLLLLLLLYSFRVTVDHHVCSIGIEIVDTRTSIGTTLHPKVGENKTPRVHAWLCHGVSKEVDEEAVRSMERTM